VRFKKVRKGRERERTMRTQREIENSLWREVKKKVLGGVKWG